MQVRAGAREARRRKGARARGSSCDGARGRTGARRGCEGAMARGRAAARARWRARAMAAPAHPLVISTHLVADEYVCG